MKVSLSTYYQCYHSKYPSTKYQEPSTKNHHNIHLLPMLPIYQSKYPPMPPIQASRTKYQVPRATTISTCHQSKYTPIHQFTNPSIHLLPSWPTNPSICKDFIKVWEYPYSYRYCRSMKEFFGVVWIWQFDFGLCGFTLLRNTGEPQCLLAST